MTAVEDFYTYLGEVKHFADGLDGDADDMTTFRRRVAGRAMQVAPAPPAGPSIAAMGLSNDTDGMLKWFARCRNASKHLDGTPSDFNHFITNAKYM